MDEAADSTDAVAREFARALHQIAGLGDADESWRAATRLGELAGQALEDAARLRAAVALRIYQDEGLSLGQLGRRLGVSKARAADLVGQARKHGQAPVPGPVQDRVDALPPDSRPLPSVGAYDDLLPSRQAARKTTG